MNDPLKLVIVRDMWLTGFDAPCCHTMYVDKPMKGHNLMQAIARVNRVFKNKPGGLVVDYIGIANELKRLMDLVLAANKAYSLCSTLDEAKELRLELAFFSAVKAAINKFTTVDKKRSREEQQSALKQILDNAIVAEGVADVFALCGLEKPNIGLLSDEFLDDVRRMPHRNLAVELLEKLLKDDIRAKTRNNVVQEKKFSERLQATLRKYNNRPIETAQVIEELIQMAKDFQAEMSREAELGLNPDEVAFYDALANNAGQ